MLSDHEFAILNGIYLKKMATAAMLAEITGLPEAQVDEHLAAAADRGALLATPGGAMLLEGGTAAVLEHYRQAYAPTRGEPELAAWYEAFEPINTRFIGQVTEWQQSDGDDRTERRLLQTARRLARDIQALVPRIPRYAAYASRFERAMERVDQGLREFVCKPTVDSVHNIWFEFHEDILAVLGRPRDTT